jgi:hypothetical protein
VGFRRRCPARVAPHAAVRDHRGRGRRRRRSGRGRAAGEPPQAGSVPSQSPRSATPSPTAAGPPPRATKPRPPPRTRGGKQYIMHGRIIDPRTKPSYPGWFSAIYLSKTAGLIKINQNSRLNGATQLYNSCHTAKIQPYSLPN